MSADPKQSSAYKDPLQVGAVQQRDGIRPWSPIRENAFIEDILRAPALSPEAQRRSQSKRNLKVIVE